MNGITAGLLADRRHQLEEGGAQILGKLMFAFGRLEYSLGLAVRSVGEGKYLGGTSFNSRLESLAKAVDGGPHYSGFSREPYERWIERAHRVRQTRNDMVHGRWVPDPQTQCIINVISSPDFSAERSTPYALLDLENLLSVVNELQRELTELLQRADL